MRTARIKERSLQIVIIILVLIGLLGLAACRGSTAQTQMNSSTPDSASTALATSPVLGATAGPPDPSATDHTSDLSDIVALAYSPAGGSLFKADRQGLSRWRADQGWEKVNTPQEASLSGVAVNPDQPETMYASSPDFGVIRSDDRGASWQEVNSGLPGLEVTALAIHSFRRETLYAWVNNQGIYRTEDGGAAWQKVPEVAIADPKVRGLIHSTLPGSMNTGWLYAATPSGAYLSMD